MKIVKLILAATLLIWTARILLTAEHPNPVTVSEVAARHCNAEWARIDALNSDAWGNIAPFEIDPNIDAMTTDAFNKYAAANIALADYSRFFVGLADEANHSRTYLETAQARYDLAMCLMPTEPERDLVIRLARTSIEASDMEIRDNLFAAFDQFDCLQMAQASEAIFKLDPSLPSFSANVEAIISAELKACKT